MIHINRGGVHELLTKEEALRKYPDLDKVLNAPPPPYLEEGAELMALRRDVRMPLRMLAEKVGLKPSELCAIEHGRAKATPEQVEQIRNWTKKETK